MCLTESHLTSDINNFELSLNDWDIIRSDRNGRIGGGVICYIKNSLTPTYVHTYDNMYCESVCFYIHEIETAVITVYRPPKCGTKFFKDTIENINVWCDKLFEDNINPKFIINGDFNFPELKGWNISDIESLISSMEANENACRSIAQDKIQAKALLDISQKLFTEQKMKDPTRKNNILDLFFCNDDELIVDQMFIESVITSDHSLNIIRTNINIDGHNNTEKLNKNNPYTIDIRKYELLEATNEEWENLQQFLYSQEWIEILQDKSVDVIADIIINKIEEGVKKCMRLKGVTKNIPNNFKSNNRIPRNVRSNFKSRNRLSKKLRKSTSGRHCLALRKKILNKELELKKIYEKRIEKVEEDIFAKSKENKQVLFRFIKNKQKIKSSIGPFMKNKKVMQGSIADILMNQYKSVYTVPRELIKNWENYYSDRPQCSFCANEETHMCYEDNNLSNYISNLWIDELDIEKAIKDITPSESSGPDGISGIILTKCSKQISLPLSYLWNMSFKSGIVPKRLKDGLTIPAQKPGSDRPCELQTTLPYISSYKGF